MDTKALCLRIIVSALSIGVTTELSNGQLADHFRDAGNLGSRASFAIDQVIDSATVELGEAPLFYPGQESVWGHWTAPADGLYLLHIDGRSAPVSAAVFRGDAFSNLDRLAVGQLSEPVPNGESGRLLHFEAKQGQRYYMSFGLPQSIVPARIAVRLSKPHLPPNDRYATAIDLGAEVPITFTADTSAAIQERLDPWTCAEAILWWTWTVPQTGHYHISVQNPDSIADLFVGPDSETFPSFMEQRGLSSQMNNLTKGQRIRIGLTERSLVGCLVGEYQFPSTTTLGETSIHIRKIDWPVGKNTTLETAIDFGSQANPISEPQLFGFNDSSGSIFKESTDYGGWWHWVPPFSGYVEFRVLDTISSFVNHHDSFIRRTPERRGQERTERIRNGAPGKPDTFWVDKGEEIHLFAASNQFTLEQVPPPSNDDFENAEVLERRDSIDPTITWAKSATNQAGEPAHGNNELSQKSVWWQWSPDTSGVFALSVPWERLHDSGAHLAVYTGDDLTSLKQIVKGPQLVTFAASPEITYHMAAAAATSEASIRIQKLSEAQAAPTNDLLVNATDLPSRSPVLIEGSTVGATVEPNEPEKEPGSQSVWWNWIAPSTGVARLRSTNPYLTLSAYHKPKDFRDSPLADGHRQIDFPVARGKRYHLSIASSNLISPAIISASMHMVTADSPINDAIERARPIKALPYAVTWHNHSNWEKTPHWWSLAVSKTGFYQVWGPGLEVYRDRSPSPIQQIPIAGDGSLLPAYFHAEAGEHVLISASPEHAMFFKFIVKELEVDPVADQVADAVDLGIATTITRTGMASLATEEADDPENKFKTVWYQWKAPHSGLAYLSLISPGSSLEISVFQHSPFSDLSPVEHPWYAEEGKVYTFMVGAHNEDRAEEASIFEWTLNLEQPKSAYDTWLVTQRLAGSDSPNDDPDRDGLSNFKEFIYGTDPLTSIAKDEAKTRLPSFVLTEDGPAYSVQIRDATRLGREPVIVYLEESVDLQTWTRSEIPPGRPRLVPVGQSQTSFFRVAFDPQED